ncbi:CooT family nickel-binding protein [Anaerospora sp.]|jgi:predicted RNA-binding protein|uniref:CooT family nickel-binding protein n=1 Tax=Anaerospora sp. TaxID=1960278 RepID=UPI00289E9C60|nr:CooT family nickel-binding protein [Anaerospora sp.]
MCEANAYLVENGQENLILESVDKVVPSGTEVYLQNIFGQQKTIKGRIKELLLVDHRIILERFTPQE